MKSTILSISGKPGLYKLLTKGKATLIVESLDAKKKRMPVCASHRVTSLNDIAMYTYDEDVPLNKILLSLKTLEEGKKSTVDFKKADSETLREYFAKILPDFDRERVHDYDIRKLIQWYNILIDNGITDFEEEAENDTDEKEG